MRDDAVGLSSEGEPATGVPSLGKKVSAFSFGKQRVTYDCQMAVLGFGYQQLRSRGEVNDAFLALSNCEFDAREVGRLRVRAVQQPGRKIFRYHPRKGQICSSWSLGSPASSGLRFLPRNDQRQKEQLF